VKRLEERELLATYVWMHTNAPDVFWSDQANWAKDGNPNVHGVPGGGDAVVFNARSAGNLGSTVDAAWKAGNIANLTVTAAWQSHIDLNRSLEVTGRALLQSGAIAGTGEFRLSGTTPAQPSEWDQGAILGSGQFTIGAKAVLNIAGGVSVGHTLGRRTVNSGTINWDSGGISLYGVTITNKNQFIINCDAKMVDAETPPSQPLPPGLTRAIFNNQGGGR
jgi:hypothetical protein